MKALAMLIAGAALASSAPQPSTAAESAERLTPRQSRPAAPAPLASRGGSLAPGGAPAVSVPPPEARLCATLDEFAARDRAAGMNEMKLADLRDKRGTALTRSLPEGGFTNWVGTIVDLHTGFEGKAVLRVQLPCRGALETWGSFISDIFDKTQIPRDSKLFATLSHMRTGSQVAVSGSFIPSREDGFREASATERASMTDPEFVVHFRSVVERPHP
jgi:hypothetical protein